MPSIKKTHTLGARAGQVYEQFFDEEDRDIAEKSHAHYRFKGGQPAAMRFLEGGKLVYLHRAIAARMGIVAPIIDHINGNPFDNRRANLRASSKRQNQRNNSAKGVQHMDGKWLGRVTLSTDARRADDIVNITADKLYTLSLGKNVKLRKNPSGTVFFFMIFHGPLRDTEAEARADYIALKAIYHAGELGYGVRNQGVK